jgi:hypothetical protein
MRAFLRVVGAELQNPRHLVVFLQTSSMRECYALFPPELANQKILAAGWPSLHALSAPRRPLRYSAAHERAGKRLPDVSSDRGIPCRAQASAPSVTEDSLSPLQGLLASRIWRGGLLMFAPLTSRIVKRFVISIPSTFICGRAGCKTYPLPMERRTGPPGI